MTALNDTTCPSVFAQAPKHSPEIQNPPVQQSQEPHCCPTAQISPPVDGGIGLPIKNSERKIFVLLLTLKCLIYLFLILPQK